MANSLSAMSPQYWSKRMGYKLYKIDFFRALASFEEQPTLTDGQKVDRPYRSDIVVENYSKGVALTAQDLTATDDILTVSTIKAALLYVDNVDKIQNKYSAANLWIDEASKRLSNAIDATFFYEVFSANNTVDDGSIGGTSGNGITLNTGNILDVLAAINLKLDLQNVADEDRFLIMTPQFWAVLWKFIAGKYSLLGDRTGQYGNLGEYADMKIFKSNNQPGSATCALTATPSDADTVTISGITFTFKTTIGSTAGNILIGGSINAAITNLAGLINAGGVTTDAGVSNVSLSLANQRAVQMWTAVFTATSGTTLEVRVRGGNYISVSSSNALNPWTTTLQIQNCLAGKFGSIDAVIQKEPSVLMDTTVAVGKAGMNILPMTLFGVYTFFQGRNQIVRVMLNSSNY